MTGSFQLAVAAASRRPRGSEKWFDRVAVLNPLDQAEIDSYRGREFEPQPPPYDVPEIQPTRRQAQVIQACLEQLDRYLVDLGRPPARMSPNRVHLVSDAVFQQLKKDKETCKAFCSLGHVYLNAEWHRKSYRLAGGLSHELCHVGFFCILIITPRPQDDNWPLAGVLYGLQVGMIEFMNPGRHFLAFNEAVTEMAAHCLRRRLIKDGLFRGRDAARLDNYWFDGCGYGMLIHTLCRLFGGKEMRGAPRICCGLTRQMLNGGLDFIQLLEKHGLLEDLAVLDSDDLSLATFVEAHADLHDDIPTLVIEIE
ncbi:MAG: hypothetical protein PHT12_02785 [Patescibacteria group bacterium]|nr:hypothetical protein [Patescibacteria group bacterium]